MAMNLIRRLQELAIDNLRQVSDNPPIVIAEVAELADAQDSKSCGAYTS